MTETTTPAAAAPAQRQHSNGSSEQSRLEQMVDLEYSRRFEPRDDDAAWKLAESAARANVCGVKTADDGYMRIIKGASIGLPAMASLEQIHPLWQKSAETYVYCMSAAAKVGLLLSRPDKVAYIRPKPGACSNTSCTWVGRRVGPEEPEQEYTFTIEDARTAGLVGRGDSTTKEGVKMNSWDRYPRPMLEARAKGRLAHILAEDVLLGIATAEELEDSDDYAQRQAEQIRQVAEEVVDRVQAKRSLDDKLAARETPAAPAPVTARDWQAEASVLKTKITEAIASNDAASKKAVQAEYKAFEKGAPPEVTADLLAFYNVARGKKSVDKKPAPGDPNPEAPPADATGPAAASTAGPAATPPVAQTAPAKAAQTAPAGPACVQCGEAIPEGQTPKWVPTANGGLGGFRHQECQPKAAPMPTGQPAHGFGGPRPVAEPADAEPPPHVKTVGSDPYLPPHERGDAYDGPEEPPIPFGSP